MHDTINDLTAKNEALQASLKASERAQPAREEAGFPASPSKGAAEGTEGLRPSGIDVVGAVPWGTHFCQFYATSQDLVETLVPYFRAGLAANEFCMWITSAPLQKEDALAALRLAEPKLEAYLARGQIEILDYRQWYTRTGQFDADLVLQGWTDKLVAARACGFDGLRLSGNTFWLEQATWDDFTLYEEKVNSVIGGQRMMALCTYSLEMCGVREVMDVVANHQFALIKSAGTWEIIESAQHAKTERALRESEERLRWALQAARGGAWDWDLSSGLVWWSQEMYELWGVAPGTELNLESSLAIVCEQDRQRLRTAVDDSIARRVGYQCEFRIRHPQRGERWMASHGKPVYDAAGRAVRLLGISLDITERKLAEEALRQSQEWLRVTLTSIGDGVIATDAGGRIIFVNPTAAGLTGWTIEEALGQPIQNVFAIVNEQTHRPAEDITARALKENRVVLLANHTALITKDGRQVPIEDSAAPILDAQGNTAGVVLVFHDVTDKRRAQEALRESEVRYRSLFTQMSEGFALHEILCDASGQPVDYRFLDVNPAFEQFTGLSREQVLGRTVLEVLPDTEPFWIATYGGVALTGQPVHFQHEAHSLGKVYEVMAFCPQPGQFAALFIDVTERVHMAEQAREAAARIEVHHRLIEQREQERLQIARDLHDGPVQALLAATYTVHSLRKESTSPETVQALEQIQNSLQEQVHDLRAYAGELRPPILVKFGLAKAIHSHLETFQKTHPEMRFQLEVPPAGPSLAEETRITLFRIYQESLTNIIRHARATGVTIRLSVTGDQAVLEIQDNGVGFEVPKDWLDLVRHGHLGLVGMRERAEAVGGSVTVQSQPGQGTRIQVVVPINH